MGPGPIALMFAQRNQNERKFQDWYAPVSQRLGIDPNPDAPEHFYDHRAFYRDMLAGKPGVVSPDKPGGHFPSTYKLPGHPRTFLDDGTGRIFDTRTAAYADGSPVPQERLTASEQSPDMLPLNLMFGSHR